MEKANNEKMKCKLLHHMRKSVMKLYAFFTLWNMFNGSFVFWVFTWISLKLIYSALLWNRSGCVCYHNTVWTKKAFTYATSSLKSRVWKRKLIHLLSKTAHHTVPLIKRCSPPFEISKRYLFLGFWPRVILFHFSLEKKNECSK